MFAPASAARSRADVGGDVTSSADPFEPTLRALAAAGFAKACEPQLSAFARVLGGAAWALQQLVAREAAASGRVQWDALFRPLTALKDRLGLAQDVARCVDALPLAASAASVQPHQLLLQDFGDIGAVHRLVEWLLAQLAAGVPHLDAIRAHRRYQHLLHSQEQQQAPVSADVRLVQHAFRPRRRWRCAAADGGGKSEAEDALIQRCLLEYGERVGGAVVLEDSTAVAGAERGDGETPPPLNLMAQLASQAAAAANAGAASVSSARSRSSASGRRGGSSVKRFVDPDFEVQYQKAMRQAAAEQRELLARQREREVQLLQQVESVPELPEEAELTRTASSLDVSTSARLAKELGAHEAQLIADKRALETHAQEAQEQAAAVSQAIAAIERELERLDSVEAQDADAQPHLATLRALVAQNEALKRRQSAFRAECRSERERLEARVALLRQQAAEDLANQDEEALRLREIEQLHAQMAAKHKEMRGALAQQTRAVQLRMRRIDEVPTRIELLQYEKRFLELYEEVALTLDETRKYFCTYNALKTALAFLEKEIALVDSIHENFDVAMRAKPATQAFFAQLEGIIENVRGAVAKQQALRADKQRAVETLDGKYQLLLEKERAYVNAIREFQRECEKNERLAARLRDQQQQQHADAASAASHNEP